jgi:hypothetical protein
VPDWSAERWLVEIAGWSGATLILLAYLLLSLGRLTGRSAVYQGMNVVGAAGFVVNGWYHGAVPSASLNVIWLLIGAVALSRILQRRTGAEPPHE